MTGTVKDLLHRLGSQIDAYARVCRQPDPQWRELPRGWGPLVSASMRCFTELGILPRDTPLQPISRYIFRAGGSALPPPLDVHWQLREVTRTLGALADLLGTAPRSDHAATGRAQRAVADEVKASLSRLAALSLRSRPQNISATDRLSRSLATLTHPSLDLTAAPTDSYLHQWRNAPIEEPTLDGLVNAWRRTAASTLRSSTATSLAIQLVAVDIAAICAVAARLQSTMNAGAGQPTVLASQLWTQAAEWPQSLCLGGRSSELRSASRRLRSTLAVMLQQSSHGEPGAQAPEDLATRLGLASRILHRAYETACVHEACCGGLTRGQPRPWIEKRSLPPGYLRLSDQLTGLHWLPAPDSLPTTALLATNSARATGALLEARSQGWQLHERLLSSAAPSQPLPTWEATLSRMRNRLAPVEPARLSGRVPTSYSAP